MKKLIVALTAGITAVCANAASVNWAAQKGYLYNGGGDSSSKITSGTAYLVLSTYLQGDLVSAFVAADGNAAATLATLQSKAQYLGTGTRGDNARIEGTATTASTDVLTAYFVVFNGNNMYISATADSTYDALMAEHSLTFTSMTTSSKAVPLDAKAGYSDAGWYAVPEPTSGLLLLIGMVGLALKRKRA